MGKTVIEVLSTARGHRPRAVLKTKGTVFPNTDQPRPANNVFIFFSLENSEQSVRGVQMGKSGPLARAELAYQIQGFRIPDR